MKGNSKETLSIQCKARNVVNENCSTVEFIRCQNCNKWISLKPKKTQHDSLTNISAERWNMAYQWWQETVSHSMHDVAAELQEMVFRNQVHVHGADIMPLGQASLAIMYYNGLHLGMQFIKQIGQSEQLFFPLFFATRCLPAGTV